MRAFMVVAMLIMIFLLYISTVHRDANLTPNAPAQAQAAPGLFDLLAAASQAQSQTILHTTPDVLNAWTTPQVMLLWRGQ